MTLGERIRHARDEIGWTQSELAQQMVRRTCNTGRPVNASSMERQLPRWENDQHRPQLRFLYLLARALFVDVRWLATGEVERAA